MLVITTIGAIGTVVSAFIAVRAKNEAEKILSEIKIEINRNVSNSGNIDVKNTGTNSGIMSGINTGEVHGNVKI